MPYRFEMLRWSDLRAIRHWRYEGIYAFYDPDVLPMAALILLRAPLRMVGLEAFCVWDDARRERIGLFTYIRRDKSVEIGLAMRPDQTGHGLGLSFVTAGMDFARARYAPARFTLDVAVFNERARTVYERAGFRPLETFTRMTHIGPRDFLAMARPA